MTDVTGNPEKDLMLLARHLQSRPDTDKSYKWERWWPKTDEIAANIIKTYGSLKLETTETSE